MIIPQAMDQIQEILRDRHHLPRTGQPDDFTLRDMTEISRTQQASTSRLMSLLLLGGGDDLTPSWRFGGVGIMNIMLVSVTERTKEIGLRMAVGARSRDILLQFLVESILLCAIGGASGVVLGRLSSLTVRTTLHWPTQVSWPAMIAAVGVSLVIGVVFGYYPAWKASQARSGSRHSGMSEDGHGLGATLSTTGPIERQPSLCFFVLFASGFLAMSAACDMAYSFGAGVEVDLAPRYALTFFSLFRCGTCCGCRLGRLC